VNTSVTTIGIGDNQIIDTSVSMITEFASRNERLQQLFLFDARQMLLSVMCADECGVVWPYLLGIGNTDGIAVPDNVEALRAAFASIVAARQVGG
jgi:hypothetical protein